MTRKDYQRIADALNGQYRTYEDEWTQGERNVFRGSCERLADALHADNSYFDRQRFITACYRDRY